MHYKELLLAKYVITLLDRLDIKISFASFPHFKPTQDEPSDY